MEANRSKFQATVLVPKLNLVIFVLTLMEIWMKPSNVRSDNVSVLMKV